MKQHAKDALTLLAALAFGALVIFGLAMQPKCGPGEVRVKAAFGANVCVAGHR